MDNFGLTKNFNAWGKVNPLEPNSKKDKKRNITFSEKQFLWKSKKRHICSVCNLHIKDFFDAEFDHKRAHAKGGKSSIENTLIVHRWCNRMKSSKTLTQIKKRIGTHIVKKRQKSNKKQSKTKIRYRINLITGKKEKINNNGFGFI